MKKYKDESHPEVVKATQAYEAQTKKISELKARKDELRRSLKVEGLSIAEVRDELKKYNMQLANLTPGTEKFNETKKHVDELKERLKELNSTATEVGGSLGKFTKGINLGQFKTILSANAVTGVISAGLEIVTDYASRAFNRVKDLVTESVQCYNRNRYAGYGRLIRRLTAGMSEAELQRIRGILEEAKQRLEKKQVSPPHK